MTLTQLEYVLAVEKFRHFGRAAKASHVTQPTLSMQLQKLEEEIGVIIFDRSKSPILPTTEGKKFIDQARVVMSEVRKLEDCQKANDRLEGEFRLGVIPTLAATIVPIFIKKFLTKYPDAHLIIEEMKTEDMVEALQKDEIDAGLLVTPLKNNGIVERALFYENFLLYVAPDHPLSKLKTIKEENLDMESLLLLNEGHCFRDQVLNICHQYQASKHAHGVQFESGQIETLIRMVESLGGYTFLPQLHAETLLPARKKKFLKTMVGMRPVREVSLVHSRLFLRESFLNALEEVIVDNLPPSVESHRTKKLDVVEIQPRNS